jgi:DNA-binding NarL/FixJ family response regulator
VSEPICILLVEDNPSDVMLFRKSLEESEYGEYSVDVVERLSDCLNRLKSVHPDVIVLDLGLPDSHGRETLLRLLNEYPEAAIVVFTSVDDREMGLWAIRNGAQDFLFKSHVNSATMAKAILYSMERHRALSILKRERQTLERFSKQRASVTADVYSRENLFESVPEEMSRVIAEYRKILDEALDQALYKGDDLTERCRSLGERLGFLRASPREMVEVHRRALELAIDGVGAQLANAYAEEGRMVALQVMGYLAAFYRNYSIAPHGKTPRKANNG